MAKRKNGSQNDIDNDERNSEVDINTNIKYKTTKENDSYDGLVFNESMYYVRFLPSVYIAEICTINIRTVYDDCIIATDKDSHERRIINRKYVGNLLFKNRRDALNRLTELKKEKHYVEQKHILKLENETDDENE